MFSVSACTKKECDDQCDTIRFGLATAPITLDPRFATDAVSVRLLELISARLVQFDQQDQPVPMLADWKAISPTQYRFTLGDKYRYFHNGARLTSKDIVATYSSVLDEKNASPHRASISHIDRVVSIDEDTVDIYLDKPDPLFPGRCVIGILPVELIEQEHKFNVQPIGSGAMRFVSWPQSGKLTLARVEDDQQIEFLTVKDPTVRALKLVRGELDLFQGEVPYELLPWLKDQEEVSIKRSQGSTFSYLGFNLEDEVLRDERIRQAISLAIDREEIIQYVFRDAARPANGLFAPEHWVGRDDLQTLHDLEMAKDLLQSAGISNESPVKFVYKTSSNPFRIRLATILQSQLAPLGLELDIQSLDWGTFYADVKAGRFQMYSLSWVGLKLPDAFRTIFHSQSLPPVGANRGRLNDSVLDKMIEDAEKLDDVEQQAEAYRNIQKHLFDTLPIVPLWYEDVVLVKRDRVKGYDLARDGAYTGLINVTLDKP